jgi:hypothetical protein
MKKRQSINMKVYKANTTQKVHKSTLQVAGKREISLEALVNQPSTI